MNNEEPFEVPDHHFRWWFPVDDDMSSHSVDDDDHLLHIVGWFLKTGGHYGAAPKRLLPVGLFDGTDL